MDDLPPGSWNETARAYPPGTLHELFEAQVLRTPDATALSFGDERLTFAELDARADHTAGHLVDGGVAPGSLVAVCMERSLEMVVALYAILKAGAAYVPIDPEYPDDRIDFMLDDASAAAVLTQDHLVARLGRQPARVIAMSELERGSGDPGRSARRPVVASDDLAYVIYTSGSTGRPKGAMITHRAITNRIHWMQDAYRLRPDDRVLQKTPFSFDVSVWEFFWPLLFGAELVIAEPGGHRDGAYLARTIRSRSISIIHFVPSMLQLFLEDPQAGGCTSLRQVICSGEALPRALQDRFFATLPDTHLDNLYGPTEAAVDVTAWRCDPHSPLPFVPIGRPIANTRIHILDADLRPVAIGQAAELHIGGVQVARGYLNRDELTAERFVPDPFTDDEEARLYKTGDLARYLPDGAIEFLGRADFQVKIRGFRVELGEVEASLEAIEGVRQAVVVARERAAGDVELVAYVATDGGTEPPPEQLRERLAARLPDYMVPARFVPIDRFPLTASGKVDRRALPAPTRRRPESSVPYVAPRSDTERFIADRWRRILDLDEVGADDPFFELGGSSLQAARFVNELRSDLGESIFVVTIFQAPTVAAYAAFLEARYPAALARHLGLAHPSAEGPADAAPITDEDIERFRSVIPTSRTPERDVGERNPAVVLILSPPRSGTTLLRIMLAGHPDLFAASELQLLGFTTLQERAAAYAGRFSGWLDGTVRTLMEATSIGPDEARERMREAEASDLTTKGFYRLLQEAISPRMLVDKSPSYALDPTALRRSERYFEDARYVHLVRHPAAMIESFVSHNMDQVMYLDDHPFSPRQLAELIWTVSHQNIVDFLAGVPEERQVRLRFEELVREPEREMEALCSRLGLRFDRAVVRPYDDVEHKMIDGVYAESAPMGDPGFLAHGRIDPALGAVAPADEPTPPLGATTWATAAALGYARTSPARPARSDRLDRLTRQRGRRRARQGEAG